ncbi:hypothetical protein DXG01_002473 [Tephrocybe rancida]|nr:hypothetical protein DXG01_002473 [Tephrocybe rancida]
MDRDFERDIIPVARSQGAVECLAAGKFRTVEEEEARRQADEAHMPMIGNAKAGEKKRKISAALQKVAKEFGTDHITAGGPSAFQVKMDS